jgi:hypothetical protein
MQIFATKKHTYKTEVSQTAFEVPKKEKLLANNKKQIE